MGTMIIDQLDGDVRPDRPSAEDERPCTEQPPVRLDALELRRMLTRARQLEARRRAD